VPGDGSRIFPTFTLTNINQLVASIHSISIEGLNGKEIQLSQFKGKKLLIVNVASEEPLEEEAIGVFCQTMYQVTFPLSKKINIRSIPAHPLFQWLTEKDQNGVSDNEVTWNFQKYAIGPDGQWQHVFSPETSPLDDQILNWIAAA
jgi:glutathione peroxidase